MNKSIVKDTLALFLITVIAGVLLGLVYEVTKSPIEEQKQIRKEKAYKEVFADAQSFEEYSLDEDEIIELMKNGGYEVTISEVMEAYNDNDELLGYTLTVISHEGYGGDITLALGIRLDGTVNGISLLSISETAGLGMKANEESFYGQFANKNVEQFEYTKTKAEVDNQIDVISGATITTNAVTNGVNAGLYCIDSIGGDSNE